MFDISQNLKRTFLTMTLVSSDLYITEFIFRLSWNFDALKTLLSNILTTPMLNMVVSSLEATPLLV